MASHGGVIPGQGQQSAAQKEGQVKGTADGQGSGYQNAGEEANAERLVCLVGSETNLECSCLVCAQQTAVGGSPREGGNEPEDSMQSLQSSLQAVQVGPIDAAKEWATMVLVRGLNAAAQQRAVLARHAVAAWAQRFRETRCNRLYTAPSGNQTKCRLLSAAGDKAMVQFPDGRATVALAQLLPIKCDADERRHKVMRQERQRRMAGLGEGGESNAAATGGGTAGQHSQEGYGCQDSRGRYNKAAGEGKARG